jgi:hypothetical protein
MSEIRAQGKRVRLSANKITFKKKKIMYLHQTNLPNNPLKKQLVKFYLSPIMTIIEIDYVCSLEFIFFPFLSACQVHVSELQQG